MKATRSCANGIISFLPWPFVVFAFLLLLKARSRSRSPHHECTVDLGYVSDAAAASTLTCSIRSSASSYSAIVYVCCFLVIRDEVFQTELEGAAVSESISQDQPFLTKFYW